MGGTKPWPEVPVGNHDHTSAAVVIIGAGISGMCTAIDLLRNNIHNFIILEKSSSVGGTWNDNKYPGCCCDVWSLLYSFSFAQNPNWTREYPGQEEILQYLISTASRYNLYHHIRFNSSVSEALWDDSSKQWVTSVRLASGSKDAEFQAGESYEITSDFLVSAVGQLNQPKYPDIPGLDTFKGKTMHSARWDWSFDTRGKKIGMIGNGATAAQIAPELAQVASHLTVFQRTPNWIVPRMDAPVTALRRTAQRLFPPFMHRIRGLQMDMRESTFEAIVKPGSDMAQMFKDLTLQQMHASLPGRQEMWEKLTPKYSVGCKRILLSDDYYPTLARDNVSLETASIESITETGVKVKGKEEAIELDLLVLATGFKTLQFMHPISIVGTGGRSLNDIWACGAQAYNGVCVPQLPNFGMLYGPNTNLGHNSIILMIEAQSKYIGEMVKAVLEARVRDGEGSNQTQKSEKGAGVGEKRIALVPKQERVDGYNAEIQSRLQQSSFNDPACNSWYKDPATGRITNNWAGTVVEYQERLSVVSWEDFEDGEKVVGMRDGEDKVRIGRVREETYLSDAALAAVAGVAAVAVGVAGWVVRSRGMVGRVKV